MALHRIAAFSGDSYVLFGLPTIVYCYGAERNRARINVGDCDGDTNEGHHSGPVARQLADNPLRNGPPMHFKIGSMGTRFAANQGAVCGSMSHRMFRIWMLP